MRVPVEWLRTFAKYKGSVAALAEALTLSGTEVERVDQLSKLGDGVRVGWVKTLIQHPTAERLTVAKVSLGRGPVRTIVCGAPNIRVHQKVAVVLPGTVLPNGVTVEVREVRGVKSQGMIASEAELGAGEDAAGILVLDPDSPVGVPVDRVRRAGPVLELEVTPNRPDLLSVRGVAREVAALQSLPLPKAPSVLTDHAAVPPLRLTVRDRRACPWYGARLVRGVTVRPSPRWMVDRLRAAGLSPHNVVVDVTNYVMLELGEPLHAFDAAKVEKRGGKPAIVVRPARAGERLTTLDGVPRKLRASMLVIADSKRALALAGVMGGAASAVSDSTRAVVLEAAWFEPVRIRATRRALGLSTDASARFERGVDRVVVPVALDRAAALLAELSGGRVMRGRAAVAAPAPKPVVVTTTVGKTAALLGIRLSRARFSSALTAQGFAVAFPKRRAEGPAQATATVVVPSWRFDVSIEPDLADEVGRMIGLAKLKPTLLTGALSPSRLPWRMRLQRRAEDLAVAHGATQVKLYSFQPKRLVGGGAPLEVRNPRSSDQQFLRRELLPALMVAVRKASREYGSVYLFETGHVYLGRGSALPNEPTRLGIVRIANEGPAVNFRRVRTLVAAVLGLADTPAITVTGGASFTVSAGGTRLAWGNAVRFDPGSLVAVEVDLSILARFPEHRPAFRLPSPFPPVKRDLAFYLPPRQPYGRIERFLTRFHQLLSAVELFDYFERGGKRSAAVHLTFQSLERTLSRAEVDAVLKDLTAALSQRFGVSVR